MSTTTDLTTLKINYLTQAQYDTARSQGLINADELYLTPAADSGINDVTVDGVSVVTDNVAEITMPTIPTKVSDLTNDSGFITGYTETDPTVPSWAKASSKPSYTASEVGAVPTSRTINGKALSSNITLSASDVSALPSSTTIPTITDTYSGTSSNGMSGKAVKSAIDALDGTVTGTAGSGKTLTAFSQTDGKVSATFGNISITKSQVSDFPTIPSKVSDLTNDSGFITSYTETDPVFGASAAAGISSTDISNWNAKSDFSGSYNDLTNKPTIPTVNNATLTIQKNGSTVKTFTANASSDVTANITVPTKVSDLTNDSGFITGYTETDPVFTASAAYGITSSDISTWNGKYAKPSGGIPKTDLASAVQTSLGLADSALQSFTETDPVFSASAAHGITSSDISNWNGKSDFSGSYNDLTDKPTIPTVNNATLTIQKNGVAVNTFTANASSDVTANITVPTKVSDLTNDSGFITGVTSTSTPTASTIAEFDSSAHMNSADMTSSEVSDFVDGLNLVGTGYSRIIPKMAVAIRNVTTSGTVSLTTSHKIIGCPSSLTETSDEFYFTSDGGIRVLKAGTIFAIAYTDIHSVTSGDEVAVAIGTYASGWKFESDVMKSTEAATSRSMMVFGVTIADANDIVYLRARNSTAARGTANNAKLVVLHLS